MFTPKQANSVASSLLMRAEQDRAQMLKCPSCGALSISLKARRKLSPLWKMQCPACEFYVRLKWGRLLSIGCLAILALLYVVAFVKIPEFHSLPAVVVLTWSFLVVALFHTLVGRLPLEPNP
jgi:predicted RNA-binding Zn-ribbon protein involved in translation (DUF1610 family)